MEQILQAYETVTTITMLYVNGKAIYCSPLGDIHLFDIVAEILEGDILVKYIFRICMDYLIQPSINVKKRNEAKSRKYSTEIITLNTNYADDLKLLTNTLI